MDDEKQFLKSARFAVLTMTLFVQVPLIGGPLLLLFIGLGSQLALGLGLILALIGIQGLLWLPVWRSLNASRIKELNAETSAVIESCE